MEWTLAALLPCFYLLALEGFTVDMELSKYSWPSMLCTRAGKVQKAQVWSVAKGGFKYIHGTMDASRSWCEGRWSTPARTVSRPDVIKIPDDDSREKTRMFCTTCSLVQSKITKMLYAVIKTKTKQNNKTTKQGGVLELRPAPMFSRAEPLFPYYFPSPNH